MNKTVFFQFLCMSDCKKKKKKKAYEWKTVRHVFLKKTEQCSSCEHTACFLLYNCWGGALVLFQQLTLKFPELSFSIASHHTHVSGWGD